MIKGRLRGYNKKMKLDCFPKCSYHFAFPSAVYKSSDCSTLSPTFSMIGLLKFRSQNQCSALSHCGLIFLFPKKSTDVDHFSCVYWPMVYLLWWSICSYLLLILNWIVCLNIIKIKEFFIYTIFLLIYICNVNIFVPNMWHAFSLP